MHTDSYKSRTRNVRRSARAHLIELRKARLAQRGAALAGTDAAEAPEPDIAQDPFETTPDPSFVETPLNEETQRPDTIESPAAEGDALDDVAIRNAAMAEMSDDASSTLSAPDIEPGDQSTIEPESDLEERIERTATARAKDLTEEPTPPPTDWQESPLAQLPGAGPGLVWMLNQCGVETLADLAGQDPAALSDKLGVVGQILDVSQWIAHAQQRDAA